MEGLLSTIHYPRTSGVCVKPMSERPFWSVIVPTYQREQVLCDTIEYLLGLSYPHYELLVIDQTPRHEAETEQFLRACESRYPQRFRWHFVAKANLPYARTWARNWQEGVSSLLR